VPAEVATDATDATDELLDSPAVRAASPAVRRWIERLLRSGERADEDVDQTSEE
jgi:hypothetical protein